MGSFAFYRHPLPELKRRPDVVRRLTEDLVSVPGEAKPKPKLDPTSVQIINTHIKKLLLVFFLPCFRLSADTSLSQMSAVEINFVLFSE